MAEQATRASDSLRVSDLVPLRRMLGTDSLVIRVNPDGTLVPFERMPTLFFDQSIRRLLAPELQGEFESACASAIASRSSIAFRPKGSDSCDEVMINPILDDDSNECRFVVCWSRQATVLDATNRLAWNDLRLKDVTVRFRSHLAPETTADARPIVEAAPWWQLDTGESLLLWEHHRHVAAMGLGHGVMQSLIYDAVEAAAEYPDGPAVRIAVPSADMLAGLVPVFHGAVKAAGLEPARVIVAIDVDLAVDQDLLPIIVHLRTMGMQIDIVGLDALTATLHTVSDTSNHTVAAKPTLGPETGPWVDSLAELA